MIKTTQQKMQFLQYCREFAIRLEEKTNLFLEVQIGVFTDYTGEELPITIMVNHPRAYYGDLSGFSGTGYNSDVVFFNVDLFKPVQDDYLVLNALVDAVKE